jgi:arylsulfatase A-like enzyme
MKNVILLTIDACRKDALGCYSGSDLTPFINSIQDRCVRFENNYSGGPYTQAGFPAILTSSYYLDFGRTKGSCPPGRVLVSEVLKKQGVTCAAFHSNAYLASFFGWNRGWDLYYDSMEANVSDQQPYISAWEINKKVDKWLQTRRGKDNPFFLWVHYMDVHEPYIATSEFTKAVDPEMDLPKERQFALFKDVILKRDIANQAGIEILRKLYLAKVHEMDCATRQLFAILKDNGNGDDVVIITSDHGDEFNEHGGLSHDGKMYDELINVPLLIYHPSLKTGKVSEVVTSNLDIPPTIVNLLGVEPAAAWQGQSLLPLESYDRNGAFAESVDKQGAHEQGNEPEVHMYREGDLKIIYRQGEDSWQLYNLKDDPKEQNDIYGKDTTSEYLIKKIVPRVGRYLQK